MMRSDLQADVYEDIGVESYERLKPDLLQVKDIKVDDGPMAADSPEPKEHKF